MPQLDVLIMSAEACAAVRSPADVVSVFELIRENGLIVAEGEAMPTDPANPALYDRTRAPLPADLAEVVARRTGNALELRPPAWRNKPLRRGECISSWILRVVRPDMFGVFAQAWVVHKHPDIWQAGLNLDPFQYQFVDQSIDQFCDRWTEVFEAVGEALYRRCQPSIQHVLTNSDDLPDLERAAARRELVVGWRTWYSPQYLEKFGRDLLLGLPSRTRELADGGIAQALDASPADIARGRWHAFEPVLGYLETHQVSATWPRRRKSKLKIEFGEGSIPPTPTAIRELQHRIDNMVEEAKAAGTDQPSQPDHDQVLAGFRDGIDLLLDLTLDLPDQRVKPLMPPWGDALNDDLREEQLDIISDAVTQRIDRELREQPGKRLLFELGEDVPDDVRQIFDRLSQSEPRVSYVVLPNKN